MTAELLTIPADAYHGDPSDVPSLSSSIAKLLCSSSPAHAFAAHPKLNPSFERVEEEKFDLGTAAHALLLQGENIVHIVNADSWRTNDAQAERDQARAAGLVPLLAKDWGRVEEIVAAVSVQLARKNARPLLLRDGKPEQTILWDEPRGVKCRTMIDWLHDDFTAIDDIKTTGVGDPYAWTSRTMWGIGADVQIAFNIRAVEALTGKTPQFRYIVVETRPPYALSVVSPGPDVLVIGRKKVDYAIKLWRRCLASGVWPAYTDEVCYAELPPWEEARWLERETREHA